MHRPSHRWLIAILGTLSALGPFSIDMYLPAFPAIAAGLHTDIAHVGYSLTSYFIGIAVGQLVYGPILDRFGRKRPMAVGLLIYILASIACACSRSIEALILNRVLLAFGGCVGMVGARAIVRDVFPREETARVFSAMILFMGAAPIVAPSVGSWIVAAAGWRAVFVALSVVATGMLAALVCLVNESRASDRSHSLHPWQVVRQYSAILCERRFLGFALASGTASGGLFAYIAGVPFVLMQLFRLSAHQFAWVFGLNALGFVVSSQINGRLLRRFSSEALARAAVSVQATAAALVLAAVLAGYTHTGVTLAALFVYLVSHGFLVPNTSALALHPFTRNAGSASAMLGSIQMASGALASAAVSRMHNGTQLPMLAVMLVCAVTGAALVWTQSPGLTRR